MWNYLILGASFLISFAFAVSAYLSDPHLVTLSSPKEFQEKGIASTLPYPASLRVEKPEVKGIHVTSWIAGDRRYFPVLIKLIDETELNTIVIDLKESDGRIAYEADVPLARSSGSIQKRIRNLDSVIEECKRHNIYKIARIVLFKDTYLAEKRIDLAIINKTTKGIWRDYKGEAFTGPYSKEVWDYNLSLAEDAARRGFDEIQVDYISPMIYPSHYWKGSYGYNNPNNAPYDIIKFSLRDAIRKSVDQSQTEAVIKEKIRPWLQDFTLGYPSYGAEEVRAQIRAANELGINEWLLWNPSVRYTKNALLPQTRGL